MSAKNQPELRFRAAVSVSVMAKMLSLSRARFYDLVQRGVFLSPVYSLANRRPLYTSDMQAENLAARQTGIGCNDEYVLFYERLPVTVATTKSARRPVGEERNGLVEGLKSLGMSVVSTAQVEEALAASYPNGAVNVDETVVLRVVYRYLRRLGAA